MLKFEVDNPFASPEESEEEIEFVTPPSCILICAICQELFNNPVITVECHHSFCQDCLMHIQDPRCPLCRAEISLERVHKNLALGQLANEQMVYCKHKSKGCHEAIPFYRKKEHEKICSFNLAQCPYWRKGCPFKGIKAELETHLQSCPFDKFKDYLNQSDHEIKSLRHTLQVQSNEIELLRRKLDCLVQLLSKNEEWKDAVSLLQEGKEVLPELSDLHVMQTLTGHQDTVEALAIDDENGLVYTASWDHFIKAWDLETFTCKQLLQNGTDVRELLIHSSRLYAGCGSGAIKMWNLLEPNSPPLIVRKHEEDILALEMVTTIGSPFQSYLISASSDSTIKVWSPQTLNYLGTLHGHTNWVFALASSNGKLFSGSSDKTIKVWSTSTLTCLSTLVGHEDQVRTLAVSNDHLISGSYDCSIKVWKISSLECLFSLDAQSEIFGILVLGKYLFSGDEHGTIKVWSLETRQLLNQFQEHGGSVYSFAYSRKKKYLFSASSDTLVKVWTARDNRLVAR